MSMLSHKDLLSAKSKFQFLLECDDFYKSFDVYNLAHLSIEDFVSKCKTLSAEDRTDIQLGLVFMKRSRSPESSQSLLSKLDRIEINVGRTSDHLIKIDVVRAAILLLRSRDYLRAREKLEDLYDYLNGTEHQFLFGLVAWFLGVSGIWANEFQGAEDAFQDALSVFRRFNNRILHTCANSDYGVFKKRMGLYEEATRLLKNSLKSFENRNLVRGAFFCCNNLGVVSLRRGDFTTAKHYFTRSEELFRIQCCKSSMDDGLIYDGLQANIAHLHIMCRDFDVAIPLLEMLIEKYKSIRDGRRNLVLAQEFMGELLSETGRNAEALRFLERGFNIAKCEFPISDIESEVTCRMAQCYLNRGDTDNAKRMAIKCICVSKKIRDEYELGVSLRILAEIHAKANNASKAIASYEASIHRLKGIHESYELMRTLTSYGAFLVGERREDAEMVLLEALQLSKKLEIDYFMARINIELAKFETNNGNYSNARNHLEKAEKARVDFQECDSRAVKPLIVGASLELDRKILERSLAGAQEIKSICRVYEEARFPIEEMKPDLAYQAAQAVEADSLFVIKRLGRGYKVPLAYNIPINSAKEIVRRLDRDSRSRLLGVDQDPKVLSAYTGQSLVCVPTNSLEKYVLCACVPADRVLEPRFFEYLVASAEALGRLAENESENGPNPAEGFILGDGRTGVTHPRGSFKDILTVDPEMIKLIRLAERASISDESILLEGETGVGKELFANAIHANSLRKDRPFVAINAGGMPVTLLESQLFGHIKGAYTDAVTDRIGLIEEADGGTVFLDEAGEMGPELQVKLLRLLENGEFRRLGENRVRIARVRVISATNRDLAKEVEKGTFRRDLYYRLGTVKLHIPALRFRQRDIELLLRHFLKECALRLRQANRHFQIDVKAMEALELYNWPGNIRELQNEIRRIISLIGETDVIRFAMLSQPIKDYLASKNRSDGLLERSVERYERRLILDALNSNDWNRLRTAEQLGLPRTTLLAKMRRLNVAAR